VNFTFLFEGSFDFKGHISGMYYNGGSQNNSYSFSPFIHTHYACVFDNITICNKLFTISLLGRPNF
jgi:hypothetical protein